MACKMMNALMDASRETEALFLESNWPRILTGSVQGHLSHIDTLRQAKLKLWDLWGGEAQKP